jgi:hypothetical protein
MGVERALKSHVFEHVRANLPGKIEKRGKTRPISTHVPPPSLTRTVILSGKSVNLSNDRLPSIQGQDRVWFAGAWAGYGFHEDGLKAGIAVATGEVYNSLHSFYCLC